MKIHKDLGESLEMVVERPREMPLKRSIGKEGTILIDLPLLGAYAAGPAYSGYDGFMWLYSGRSPNLQGEAIAVGGNVGLHNLSSRFHDIKTNTFGPASLNLGAFLLGAGCGAIMKYLENF
jgi:hypothetical protein